MDDASTFHVPEPKVLSVVRAAIDRVDDGLVLLLAGRRRLAGLASRIKRSVGLPAMDAAREADVRRRGRAWAAHLGVPEPLVDQVLELAIADAVRAQASTSVNSAREAALSLLPPPRRMAPIARLVPHAFQLRLLEITMASVLAEPIAGGGLEFMRGRRLGIEVTDLGLAWVVEFDGMRLRGCRSGTLAEATVRGSLTDLLLLASRQEDADTLFFQRRLQLTGDTELGLTARNLLERLPWESVPLGLRIALNRAARFAQAARRAHGGGGDPAPAQAAVLPGPPRQ